MNDYEIVVAGVAAALAPYGERVEVVELDASLPLVSEVDVVLYDTYSATQGHEIDPQGLLNGRPARLVVFSWNVQPDLVRESLRRGAAGYVSKSLSAEGIVAAVEAVHAGKTVVPELAEEQSEDDPRNSEWPGREHGLSARESEVLALITQGLSNLEIAQRTYLSINSIKTYIRTAYRKIGVARRSQAVAWGMRHGFEPDRVRTIATGRRG